MSKSAYLSIHKFLKYYLLSFWIWLFGSPDYATFTKDRTNGSIWLCIPYRLPGEYKTYYTYVAYDRNRLDTTYKVFANGKELPFHPAVIPPIRASLFRLNNFEVVTDSGKLLIDELY